MRRGLMFLILLLFVSLSFGQVYTKRILVVKETGRLIEMQSAKSREGTLLNNAISSGFKAEEVEEKLVTEGEYIVIRAARDALDPPAPPSLESRIAALEVEVARLKAKVGE